MMRPARQRPSFCIWLLRLENAYQACMNVDSIGDVRLACSVTPHVVARKFKVSGSAVNKFVGATATSHGNNGRLAHWVALIPHKFISRFPKVSNSIHRGRCYYCPANSRHAVNNNFKSRSRGIVSRQSTGGKAPILLGCPAVRCCTAG